MAKEDLRDLKAQFLEYLEIEKGRSIKTVENYDRYIMRFLTFSKATGPASITEASVREFRMHLNRQPGVASNGSATMKHKTQNYYLIAIRAFLKFLRKRNIESLNPERIELAKVGARDLDLITAAELDRLMAAPKGSNLSDLRDKAIMELLFSTGLRVSELCNLSRDLDLTRDEFSVRGKGEKVRVVFLSSEAKEAIKQYLDKRGDVDDALFVQMGKNAKNVKDLRLTPRSVERLIPQSDTPRHPPQLCDRPARKRRRPAQCAGAVGPCSHSDNPGVHARDRQTPSRSPQKIPRPTPEVKQRFFPTYDIVGP
jgi:site-specific recombinase XerD